jgi:hypothetical protein
MYEVGTGGVMTMRKPPTAPHLNIPTLTTGPR